MASWRAHGYIASIILVFPCTVLSMSLLGKRLPLVVLSVSSLTYFAALKKIVYPFYTSPLQHLPTPKGDWFFLGQAPDLIRKAPGAGFFDFMQQVPNDGLIHWWSFLENRSLLLLTTPSAIAEVLTGKPYDYHKPTQAKRFIGRVIGGQGLITVEDREHKMQRRSVAPAFSGRQIRELVPLFWSKAMDFTNIIQSEIQGDRTDEGGKRSGVVELNAIAQRITLEVIIQASLGQDSNQNDNDELARNYAIIFDPSKPALALYMAVNTLLPPSFVRLLPWKMNQIITEATLNLRTICRRLVAAKKQAIAEKSVDQTDILSVLIRSGSFDDDGLVDQLLTFLAAGHETTSSALTWAAYLLSIHPDYQQRLRDEILEQMAGSGSPDAIDASVLDRMPFLSAVCNEVLRFYPTVPAVPREAIRETTIGDQVIPKGTRLVLCPWAINRSEALWDPDAGRFNPDRWMGEGKSHQGGATSTYGMLTFLHGPRSCIGQTMALSEMRCILAALVQRFDIELADPRQAGNIIPAGIVTIKPKDGLRLRLTERM